MAHARCGAGEYTAASDVFSFGVVLLELLTGAPPVDPAQRPPNLYARMRARLPGQAEAAADPLAGWAALPGGGEAAQGLGALAARCVCADGSGRPSFAEVRMFCCACTHACAPCDTHPRLRRTATRAGAGGAGGAVRRAARRRRGVGGAGRVRGVHGGPARHAAAAVLPRAPLRAVRRGPAAARRRLPGVPRGGGAVRGGGLPRHLRPRLIRWPRADSKPRFGVQAGPLRCFLEGVTVPARPFLAARPRESVGCHQLRAGPAMQASIAGQGRTRDTSLRAGPAPCAGAEAMRVVRAGNCSVAAQRVMRAG